MGETQRNENRRPLSRVSRTSFVNKNNKLREFFDNMENYSHVMLQKIDGYWLIKQRSYSCHTMSRSSHLSSESVRPRVNLDAVTEDKVVNSVSARRFYDCCSSFECSCCTDGYAMYKPILITRRNAATWNKPRYVTQEIMASHNESAVRGIPTLAPTVNTKGPRLYQHEALPTGSSAASSCQKGMTKPKVKSRDMKEIKLLKAKIGLSTERYQGISRHSAVRTKQTQFIKFNSPVTISAKDSMKIKVKASAPALRMTSTDQLVQISRQEKKHGSKIKLPSIPDAKRH